MVVSLLTEGDRIDMIDNDLSLVLVPVGVPPVIEGEPSSTGYDSGQGKEKKHRSERSLRKQKGMTEHNMRLSPGTARGLGTSRQLWAF